MYKSSPDYPANKDAISTGRFAFDEFIVDVGASKLLRGSTVVSLPSRTFDVLVYLIRHRERSVRKDEIIAAIWDNVIVTDDSLIHAISVLRKTLGDETHQHRYIETIPRRGYRFVGKVQVLEPEQAAPPTAPLTHSALVLPSQTELPPPATAEAGTAELAQTNDLAAPAAISRQGFGFQLPSLRQGILLLGTGAIVLIAALAILNPTPSRVNTGTSKSDTSVHLFQPSVPGMTIVSGGVLSLDGRYLAFIARDESGQAGIWVRTLQGTEPRLIKGTNGASKPFWSPDSSRIGYFSAGKLFTSDLYGDRKTAIASVSAPAGGTWGFDDTILYADWTTGLYAVPASGENNEPPKMLVQRDTRDLALAWPQFFPDGRRFVYQIASFEPGREGVYMADMDSDRRIRLLDTASPATLAPPNHLLYVQKDMLIAEEFDPQRQEMTGHAIIVARDITEPTVAVENFISASEGLLAFNQGVKKQNLVWFDRQGRQQESLPIPTMLYNPRISPDGARILASSSLTSNPGLWLTNVDREQYARIETDAMAPIWSPDGKKVAFTSRDGTDLLLKSSDGEGSATPLLSDEHVKILNDWSADGAQIVYTKQSPQTGFDLWLLDVATGATRPLTTTSASETQARLSPDGKWIAYTSDESGQLEIYVASFPSLANRTKVSVAGGGQAQWRSDQAELFYLSLDQTLMASPISTSQTLQVSKPVPLFRTAFAGAPGGARDYYGANATGTRFLVDADLSTNASPGISILVNWTSRLRTATQDLALSLMQP